MNEWKVVGLKCLELMVDMRYGDSDVESRLYTKHDFDSRNGCAVGNSLDSMFADYS